MNNANYGGSSPKKRAQNDTAYQLFRNLVSPRQKQVKQGCQPVRLPEIRVIKDIRGALHDAFGERNLHDIQNTISFRIVQFEPILCITT